MLRIGEQTRKLSEKETQPPWQISASSALRGVCLTALFSACAVISELAAELHDRYQDGDSGDHYTRRALRVCFLCKGAGTRADCPRDFIVTRIFQVAIPRRLALTQSQPRLAQLEIMGQSEGPSFFWRANKRCKYFEPSLS
jgi:hypothetical protein